MKKFNRLLSKILIKKIFSSGYYIQYEYNTKGKLITEIDSNGNSIQFEYDDNGNMTKKILPTGYYIQYKYRYDEIGRLIKAGDMNIEYLA